MSSIQSSQDLNQHDKFDPDKGKGNVGIFALFNGGLSEMCQNRSEGFTFYF